MIRPIVTNHALVRYRERIANASDEAIRLALDTPAVRTAIQFGAPFVRLGTGQRVVLDQDRVITILPSDCTKAYLGNHRQDA